MSEQTVLVLAIFLCLLGNGLFSGAEIAVLSMRRGRVEALVKEGRGSARRLQHLQENLDDFLATVQIGVTVMGTLAGVLGGYLSKLYLEPLVASTPLAGWIAPAAVAGAVVGGAIVYVELTVGELVPKALALRFTDTVALLVSRPLDLLMRWSRWAVVLLTRSTRAMLALLRVQEPPRRTFVSLEELKHLVREGREQGLLDQTEMDLIHGVFEFSETPVKKVMVPRPKVFALEVHTSPGVAERLMVESGFSRIPVFEGSIDNVVGLVYVKDALRLLERKEPVVIDRIRHPVHFVPETKKVGILLKELQRRRSHLAMVIDEHGSVAGLVTLEDLLEEIVGEIHDEYDWEERPVERQRDGSLVVEGTVSAADLRDRHGVPMPDSADFATVAGFMLEALGSMPRGGEVVALGDYRFMVVDVERNRISKVKIEKVGGAGERRSGPKGE
jgi:putative hemolysin